LTDSKNHLQSQSPGLIALDRFVQLLDHQNLEEMLSQALALLAQAMEASAGSILYVGQMSARASLGTPDSSVREQTRQWEDAIARQIRRVDQPIPAPQQVPFMLHPLPNGQGSLLNMPLVTNRRVAGSISLVCPAGFEPGPVQRQLLSGLSRGIGNLAELIEGLSMTQQRLSQLGLFYQMGQALVSTFDLPQLLQDTMQLAASVINAGAASLLLLDETQDALIFAVVHGEKGNLLRSQRISVDKGIAGWVVRHGEPIIANDVARDTRFNRDVDVRTGFLTQSILAVPMQIRGKTIGVLEVLNKYDEDGFDEEDLRLLLTLAAEAAIAIENARLIQALREERDRILTAQEEVRHEVNRRLHDGTVQLLAAIAMGIDHVERLLQLKPEAVYVELEALRKLTRQATREARMLLFELRPVILESQGLVVALQRYGEQLRQQEMFNVHLETRDWDKPIGQQVAGAIFSIVQEAVNNTRKHAKASNIWIRLKETSTHLVVQIEDDGLGFDVAAVEREYNTQGSFGLLNMRERAELIEGEFSIESSEVMPEQGTLVTLRVPLSRVSGEKNRSI